MEDRDDDKLSSSLPETLHAHIIRPDDYDGRFDEASSSAQRQASRLTSQFTSSLTPATFPNSQRGTSSHNGLVSPDVEDGRESTKSIARTSAGRGETGAARSAHPPRTILIPYDHRSPGSSERQFYPQYPSHSYTFPPPPPSPFYVSSPSTHQWPEGDAGPSSSSHRVRRSGGGSCAPEGCQEGDDDESTREVTLLCRAQDIQQSTPGQPALPFSARDVTGSPEDSPRLCSAPHSYDDPRYVQPPPHRLDPDSIRHASLPSQRWDQRSGSWSSSSRHVPGILDDHPVQRISSYSLPPVSDLLTPLQQEYHNKGLQLPQIFLQKNPPAEISREEKESSSEKPTDSTNAPGRGKRKRTDTKEPDERKTKARKIYVACDFCRGRKLRCDGTRPSCANCSTRTLECNYEDHPKRRGPGKAPKGSRTKKTEAKGRKGRRASKAAATSDVDGEFGSEQPSPGGVDRHVFEPPMMLPGHGLLHLSELEGVYAPLPCSDRPNGSNTGMNPRYQFTSNFFEQRPGEGQPLPFTSSSKDWRQDGDEEDGGSLDSRYALPPGSQKGDTGRSD